MADSKTCKCKIKPKSCYILAQLVKKNIYIIKGKFGVGITFKSPPKKDLWETNKCSVFLKKFMFRGRLLATAILSQLEKTIETITEFVMVLIVIMGIVLVLMQAVIVPAGLYW